MENDWDYLIVLDACRCDYLKQLSEFKHDVDCAISLGSHSEEWFNKNFSGNTYNDTVYVTANGYAARNREDIFHEFVFTGSYNYESDFSRSTHPSWENISPDAVYQATISKYKQYPNKRIISHFMQPHEPYFGEKAGQLRKDLNNDGIYIQSYKDRKNNREEEANEKVKSLMHAAKKGLIESEKIQEVYIENLKIVMEYVQSLIKDLNGKIIITADHGELLGETTIRKSSRTTNFSHHRNIYDKKLRRVPWVEIDSNTRPEIKESSAADLDNIDDNDIDDNDINEQLNALGYIDKYD